MRRSAGRIRGRRRERSWNLNRIRSVRAAPDVAIPGRGPTRHDSPGANSAPGPNEHGVTAATNSHASAPHRSSSPNSRGRDSPAASIRAASASDCGASRACIDPPSARTAAAVSTPSGAPPIPETRSRPPPAARRGGTRSTSPCSKSSTDAPAARGRGDGPSLRGRSCTATRTSADGDATGRGEPRDRLGERGVEPGAPAPGHVLLHVVRRADGERARRAGRPP